MDPQIPKPEEDVPVTDLAPAEDPAEELEYALTPRLTPEFERELAEKIQSEFDADIQDRSEIETRWAEWENQYYGRVADKDVPWEGASNFHIPLTMTATETLKPRLGEAILGQDPLAMAIPTNMAGEDRKLKVETVLNWYLHSVCKVEEKVQESAHTFLIPGLAIAKTYWKKDRRMKKVVREFPLQMPIQAILQTLFDERQPKKLEKVGDLEWKGMLPAPPRSGDDLEVKIRMKVLPDAMQVLVEREEITEGPQIDIIDPMDLFVPVKGGTDIADQPSVKQRLWLSEDDLRQRVKLGVFYADVVDEMIESDIPEGDKPGTDSAAYSATKDQAEGVEGQGPSNVRASQYPIIEDYRRMDIDDDGIDEEIIVWVSSPHANGRILGWDYLDNVYGHGRRPIRVGKGFPIPFRFYGLSLAEVIKAVQDEINTIHNQKVDYATIQNMPFGFVRASSTLPPISQRLKPGEFLELDNPQQDVNIPKWQGSPAWGNQEEATLYQYAERLLGLTDLSLGRQPNRVGATRTAKGTQTLLSESGLRAKPMLMAFQRFWIGIFEDVLALLQEYMPPNQEFRITGKRPTVIRVKNRAEIRGQFDLRLSASTETFNREQQRQDATVIMQAVMNPSLIQTGIVGLKGVRKATTDLLRAYGRDPDFYLEEQGVVRSPNEELGLFNVGQYISPTMGEDIPGHLAAHQAALQDPSIRPQVKRLIQKHIQETLQLQQTKQMAQSLQGPKAGPPVGQQAQNAAIGAQPQPMQPANGPADMSKQMGGSMPGGIGASQ